MNMVECQTKSSGATIEDNMRTYHKLDEVNFDFLKLIDLATDPAMRSIFERAQVACHAQHLRTCPSGNERVGHPTG
jgi:hypothetical protein